MASSIERCSNVFTTKCRTFARKHDGIFYSSYIILRGVVQHIEAASMEVYLGYRHDSADFDLVDGNGARVQDSDVEDFDSVIAGSKIAFWDGVAHNWKRRRRRAATLIPARGERGKRRTAIQKI